MEGEAILMPETSHGGLQPVGAIRSYCRWSASSQSLSREAWTYERARHRG